MNKRVKEVRNVLKLSQEDFGQRIGITRASISNIEKGSRNMSEQTLKSICREFNVSYAWLKDGKGDMFTNLPETLLDEVVDEYHLNDKMKKLIKTLLELDEQSQSLLINILESTFNEK